VGILLRQDPNEWIPPAAIQTTKKEFPALKIILQTTDFEGNIKEKIEPYIDFIDGVQIDPSRGTGKNLNVESSTTVARQIEKLAPDLPIVFVGGLSGENVGRSVSKLAEELGGTHFSIDAESALRDPVGTGEKGSDVLNFEKLENYLTEANRAFNIR
jgi:hypothetical protein